MPPAVSPANLEALISDGARLVQALRPVWREVSYRLPRGRGRNYFAFAVGLIGVAIVGTYIVSHARRQQQQPPSTL